MNIEDLERRVSQLEQALKETGRYLCPLCGGNMSASTKYNNHYCLQSFGLCGEWVLNKPAAHRKKNPFTTFTRTTVMEGKVSPMNRRSEDSYHYFFIADEMVEKDEYMRRSGLATEQG